MASGNKWIVMKVLKYCLLLLFVVAGVSYSKAQNPSASIELVLFEMTMHNVYESSSLGIAGAPSSQYKRFVQMKKLASSKQLLHFATNHHNAVVRLYALKALKETNINIPASINQQFKNDSTSVHIFIGCIQDIKKVSTISATYIN